jgi:hypothetical protein
MMKLLTGSAAGLTAALAFSLGGMAGQGRLIPLNVKTGLWQTRSQVTMSGTLGLPPEVASKMTPEQRAQYEAAMGAMSGPHEITSKGCLTEADLTKDPYAELNRSDEEMQCRGTVVRSTGSDLELHEVCTGQGSQAGTNMEMNITIHADNPEHTTGQGQGTTTMGGKALQSQIKLDMTWLGATCPADLQH